MVSMVDSRLKALDDGIPLLQTKSKVRIIEQNSLVELCYIFQSMWLDLFSVICTNFQISTDYISIPRKEEGVIHCIEILLLRCVPTFLSGWKPPGFWRLLS